MKHMCAGAWVASSFLMSVFGYTHGLAIWGGSTLFAWAILQISEKKP